MKKKIGLSLASSLLATQLFAIDFNISWEDILSGNFNFSSLLNDINVVDTVTQCYQLNLADLAQITDLCTLLDYSRGTTLNTCSLAPDIIPGFTALNSAGISQKFGVSTYKLQSYCNELKSKAVSYLATQKERFKDLTSMTTNLWALQNDMNGEGKLPNGQDLKDFYDDVSVSLSDENIEENKEDSLFLSYLFSKEKFHQATARFMMALGMNMDSTQNNRMTTTLKIDETTKLAAQNINEYVDRVKELSTKINDDLDLSSPTTISENLSAVLPPYQGISGKETSSQLASVQTDYVNKKINDNAREKKGILKTLLASEDDLAIPTQETLDKYSINVRPKYAMLIQRQQMREAYIDALVDTETKLKQDIVNLSTKKAVIMKSSFDRAAASSEIDSLIGSAGGLLDSIGGVIGDKVKDTVLDSAKGLIN